MSTSNRGLVEEIRDNRSLIEEKYRDFAPSKQTPRKLFEGLKLDIPVCVPVYDRYQPDIVQIVEPREYIYISIPKVIYKNIEAYVVHTCDFAPVIEDGDVVLVERDNPIFDRDTVAYMSDGELHVGKLRKVGSEKWLENTPDRKGIQDCAIVGKVVRVEKWLK